MVPALSPRQLERYHRHIDSDASGWYRRFTESIWRRHQHPSNAALSGWTSAADMKRRLMHFYDEYAVVDGAFVLRNAYLHLNLTLPRTAACIRRTKRAATRSPATTATST